MDLNAAPATKRASPVGGVASRNDFSRPRHAWRCKAAGGKYSRVAGPHRRPALRPAVRVCVGPDSGKEHVLRFARKYQRGTRPVIQSKTPKAAVLKLAAMVGCGALAM